MEPGELRFTFMKVLVVGANGATGRLVVARLLEAGQAVKAVVRNPASLPTEFVERHGLETVGASLLDCSDKELSELVEGCGGIISCLGHNITLRGVFGHPRRLVTDAVRRLVRAVEGNAPEEAVRFVLMNTAGNVLSESGETVSRGERFVLSLLRRLVPPHADNEDAAAFLQSEIGERQGGVEWVAVRPDSLVDEDEVSEYELHRSPTRSAIFNPGKTSRINVADFMSRLVSEDDLWWAWRGKMPVIYNCEPKS